MVSEDGDAGLHSETLDCPLSVCVQACRAQRMRMWKGQRGVMGSDSARTTRWAPRGWGRDMRREGRSEASGYQTTIPTLSYRAYIWRW